MRTLIMKIEYDGTDLAGWQIQDNAETVQGLIEKSLFKIAGEYIGIIGAGRTDAGVHAGGQTAHALLPESFSVPEEKIAIALNSRLPDSVRIIKTLVTERNFHARFNAVSREYCYRLSTVESVFERRFRTFYKYPIDFEKLSTTADVFLGKHDFTSFSKRNESTKSYICRVEECGWSNPSDGHYDMRIKADRFVYGMVRALTGAMLECARGKLSRELIAKALEKPVDTLIPALVPAQGLTLERVYYPGFDL